MTVSLKKKRATIRDVGRRARVERAIAELGFHPN
jgi:hypothetical protein